MIQFDVLREIRELKNQLSYASRYGFFFGAGTSCALGVPNIATLTDTVEENLQEPQLSQFQAIKNDLITTYTAKVINIEDILTQVRQIRSITNENKAKAYLNVNGEQAVALDKKICKIIYTTINDKESVADLSNTKKFFAWLNMQSSNFSKELFTTNYDLIIEKSLEEIKAPYFDGFVGTYEPFFWQESIDQFVGKTDLTQNWLRLWKIHGSLNWFWKENSPTNSHSIIRGSKVANIDSLNNELVIYPSKEKYDSSKKQPFVAYFDRLKNVLLSGELLFIFSGYSFSDQHINEIIFNSLRQNNRLFALVFFYQDAEVEELYKTSSSHLNLTAFGPNKAIINGTLGEWTYKKDLLKPNESSATFWNESDMSMTLGDFNNLVEFLVLNSGKKDNIEEVANG